MLMACAFAARLYIPGVPDAWQTAERGIERLSILVSRIPPTASFRLNRRGIVGGDEGETLSGITELLVQDNASCTNAKRVNVHHGHECVQRL